LGLGLGLGLGVDLVLELLEVDLLEEGVVAHLIRVRG
jgi:hypothetical protein